MAAPLENYYESHYGGFTSLLASPFVHLLDPTPNITTSKTAGIKRQLNFCTNAMHQYKPTNRSNPFVELMIAAWWRTSCYSIHPHETWNFSTNADSTSKLWPWAISAMQEAPMSLDNVGKAPAPQTTSISGHDKRNHHPLPGRYGANTSTNATSPTNLQHVRNDHLWD